jgi:nucleoside-diphosphate-sugar epimerase
MRCLIIGCGFLGSHLYEKLKKQAFCCVTKTRPDDAYPPVHFELLRPSLYQKLDHLLKNYDVIIVTAAAKNKSQYAQVYLHLARRIKHALKKRSHKSVIYTSSSGVYKENQGGYVYENSDLELEASHILIETEKTYLSLQQNHRVVVARLSGLVGKERNLKKFYEKYKTETIEKKYLNLVDVDEAANFLKIALKYPLRGIFNISSLTVFNTEYFEKLFGNRPPHIVEGPYLNKRVCSIKDRPI